MNQDCEGKLEDDNKLNRRNESTPYQGREVEQRRFS